MGCGNSGCSCCGGWTSPPATPRVKNLLAVNPNNQVVLKDPLTKSILCYDPVTGYVTWQDGSSGSPICLPELSPLRDDETLAYFVGMTTDGCLRKIPITLENITTCEGPVITVPATAVG